nr:PREDICTED: rust resistance kinase Lr10-like [Daucus carota subsp. sativus]
MRLEGAAAQNEACNRVTRCGSTEIRFPFHLKERDKQHKEDHCVFPPGFQLSCEYVYQEFFIPKLEFKYQVNTSHSGLYLSLSVNASVVSINYRSQQLLFVLDSPEYGRDIRQHYYSRNSHHYNYNNLPKYPFKPFTLTDTPSTNSELHDLEVGIYSNYTFYNCSITKDIVGENAGGNILIWSVPSLGGRGYEVYAVYSPLETILYPMTSCTKMYNVSNVPYNAGGLSWSGPNCGDCEAKGQYCKFKPNSTILTQCHTKGKVVGISMVLVTLVVLYYATKSYKQKKKHLLKIEVFLEDYKALKPSRYSYADIRKISNNFNVKLGEGGYGSVYKGQLSNDVFVAIKVLNDKVDDKRSGEDFINEVSTIGLIHHVNVVRLVGYCADSCRRALVYEFQPNNSLEKYVYSREIQNKAFLGWEKMKDIALGIAKGIEYLHRGCAQPILHFDIKPHNILLDRNFNPKIADFGLAKLCTTGQSMVSMTMARGTIGYIAPEVFSRNFGKVSSKSDVYSFGMLLLEMVGARDHTSAGTENTSEAYFPEWVFHQLEQGRETRSQIEEEVNNNIAKKLTIVGLWCINWHPGDRPSMKHVIQMLQEEDCPAIPPNPFSSASEKTASMFSNMLDAISESD